ncbi:hypothetical protein V8C86DRAFT_3116318 [Haematococcus lacustris]
MSQDTSCSRLLILPTELIGNIIAHVSQLCQQSSCNEALSVSGFLLGSGALAGLVDASQQLGLQQLHVRLCAMKEPRRYTRVKAVPLRNVFRGRRLQQLSLDIWWQDVGLPRLQPLARHLTHLTLALPAGYRSAEDCLPLVQGLSQLRVLNLTMPAPLPPLYDSWSQRYNDDADDEAWGEEAGEKEEGEREEGEEAGEQAGEEEVEEEAGEEEERDESQHYELDFTGLPQLDVVGPEQLQTLAYLPLHSLTHPLHIPKLLLDANQDDLDLATAAVKNMALRCKAPVIIGSLTLRCPTAPQAASTDGHMQLAVVEALVAQLQPIVIKDVKVMGLHSVTPSTVRALAPACRAASRVTLHGGPMAPGLEVWLEMLRCMPATTHLDITGLSSHLGDMEEGLWWLRRQPRRPGGLEISLVRLGGAWPGRRTAA